MEEVTLKLREIVEEIKKESAKSKAKIVLGTTLGSLGIAFLAITPMLLIDNILRDLDKWTIYLILMLDFVIIAGLIVFISRFENLKTTPSAERIEAVLAVADYIEKGADFKMVGDLDKSFAIEIREKDKIKFKVGDELIKNSGLIEGTYVNKYGFNRVLSLNVDDIISYENEEVNVNEVLGVKIKDGDIISAYNHNVMSLFQDKE